MAPAPPQSPNRSELIARLTPYTTCSTCACTGWKRHTTDVYSMWDGSTQSANTPCAACKHDAGHTPSNSDKFPLDLIRKMGQLCDALDSLYVRVQDEQDTDTQHVYLHMFRNVRRALVAAAIDYRLPDRLTDFPFGEPPFESVTVDRLLLNFVYMQCSARADKSIWTQQLSTASLVCRCLQVYRLPTPSQYIQRCSGDAAAVPIETTDMNLAQYKINYARWMEYCYVPRFASVLGGHLLPNIFGRTLLVQLAGVFIDDIKRQL